MFGVGRLQRPDGQAAERGARCLGCIYSAARLLGEPSSLGVGDEVRAACPDQVGTQMLWTMSLLTYLAKVRFMGQGRDASVRGAFGPAADRSGAPNAARSVLGFTRPHAPRGAIDGIEPGTSSQCSGRDRHGFGGYAVGNNAGFAGPGSGDYFAVSRRCRHLRADLAGGSIDPDGCLVCPWHQAKYDVQTGRMVRGPQGIFAEVPGLSASFVALTKAWPLRRGKVTVEGNELQID